MPVVGLSRPGQLSGFLVWVSWLSLCPRGASACRVDKTV
jgi:hypothetical protein